MTLYLVFSLVCFSLKARSGSVASQSLSQPATTYQVDDAHSDEDICSSKEAPSHGTVSKSSSSILFPISNSPPKSLVSSSSYGHSHDVSIRSLNVLVRQLKCVYFDTTAVIATPLISPTIAYLHNSILNQGNSRKQIAHDYSWLRSISVRLGPLEGNLMPVRKYIIECQLLAFNIVLPYGLRTLSRFSELHFILKDSLLRYLNAFDDKGLFEKFQEVIDSFPEKTWMNRNSEAVGKQRSKQIEKYIIEAIQLTVSLFMESINSLKDLENSKIQLNETSSKTSEQEARRRLLQLQERIQSLNAANSIQESETGQEGVEETNSINNDSNIEANMSKSCEENQENDDEMDFVALEKQEKLRLKRLKKILDLFTVKLLDLDERSLRELHELSTNFGALLSAREGIRTRLDASFKTDPQQGL